MLITNCRSDEWKINWKKTNWEVFNERRAHVGRVGAQDELQVPFTLWLRFKIFNETLMIPTWKLGRQKQTVTRMQNGREAGPVNTRQHDVGQCWGAVGFVSFSATCWVFPLQQPCYSHHQKHKARSSICLDVLDLSPSYCLISSTFYHPKQPNEDISCVCVAAPPWTDLRTQQEFNFNQFLSTSSPFLFFPSSSHEYEVGLEIPETWGNDSLGLKLPTITTTVTDIKHTLDFMWFCSGSRGCSQKSAVQVWGDKKLGGRFRKIKSSKRSF